MFAIVILISTVTVFVILQTMAVDTSAGLTVGTRALLEIVLQLVTAPFMVGIMMAGVKLNAEQAVGVKDLFAYLPQSAILCLTSLMVSIISGLGFALYIIPGLYLLIATNFTLLLVTDKRMSPFNAMLLSMKMVNRYLLSFIALHLIFFVLFMLCIVTFGVALIIVGPLYFNAKGLLYKELFGYGDMSAHIPQTESSESVFNA